MTPCSDTERDVEQEPDSISHAIEMRESLKRRLVVMQSEVRGLNGWRRSDAVAAIDAAQSRCSYLWRWIKSRTIPDAQSPKSSDVVASLLAILDRLDLKADGHIAIEALVEWLDKQGYGRAGSATKPMRLRPPFWTMPMSSATRP